MLVKTKKLLSALDISGKSLRSDDFLAVVLDNGKPRLFGLKSHAFWDCGYVVFIGREISENDLFAKLVDTGRSIADVDASLSVISMYLQQLQGYRIGNVIRLESNDAGNTFRLVKVAERPTSRGNSRLP